MRQAGFRDVLAVREFRALWAAELLSVAGDQLARVGLSVLVYTQTGSAGWTALTYALTFLPALIGGVLLAGLADRYPRRELMIVVDLGRTVVAGLMAIPTLPLPVLLVLVFLLALGGAPFKAAQQALLPAILRDQYVTGLSLRTVTSQGAQVAGFVGGGALLTVLNPHLALGLNAVTFAVAAVVVAAGVRHHPRPAPQQPREQQVGVARLIWRDPRLRTLVALSWVVGVFTIPEGLAAPYAATFGAAATAVGVLMAADPVGSIVGAWLVARLPRDERLITWFAVAAGAPLVFCLLDPPLVVVVLLWVTSGACATAYLILAQAAFVLGAPDHRRGAASGLAGAGVLSSQGVAVLAAGVLADATDPVLAVATGGVAGVVFTGMFGTSWLRARTRQGHSAQAGGRETDDKGDVTSHGSSSEAPPPAGTAKHDVDGAGLATADKETGAGQEEGLTSRGSSSEAPPPEGTAAEHGKGGADQVVFARSARPASLSTLERSRAPRRWALWGESRRVLVFILFVEFAAVALTGFLATASTVDADSLVTLGVIIGLGVGMGEATRHVERVRRRFTDTPHVNLTSVWTFSAALVLPPALTPIVIVVLYLHLFWRSWYRVRSVHPYRLVFTASTVILSAFVAWTIRHLLAPADVADWRTPGAVLVIAVALVAYSATNSGLVAGAITLHEREWNTRRALGTAKESALEYGTLGLGAITALLLSFSPAWAIMIVPALLVLHRSVLMRQLEEAASTDQKTGLTNATAWTNLASAEIGRAARDGTKVGVLMVDLDHFKQVNDAYGHLVGDRVLQAVAEVLTASARRYDVVGRWGGEEFVVLCPEVSKDALRAIAERIRVQVRELRVSAEGAVVDGLTVSIGIALYPEFGPELQDVLLAADDALFVAKDSGRNQVQTIVAAIGDLNNGS